MSLEVRSHQLLQPLARRRPIMVAVALYLLLLGVLMVDVLGPQGIPPMVLSPVLATVMIAGAVWLLGATPDDLGLHRRHLGAALLVGGLLLTLLYLGLYGLQSLRLAIAGDAPRLVLGALRPDGGLAGMTFSLLFVLVMLLNSFVEEGLFRGMMLPLLMRRFSIARANARKGPHSSATRSSCLVRG